MTKFTASLFVAALCVSFSANAARPSFTSLQQQVNQLNARVNELENAPKHMVIVDANGVLIGDGQDASSDGGGVKTIYFEDSQQIYITSFYGDDFLPTDDRTYHSLPDCEGKTYISAYNDRDIDNLISVFAMELLDPNTLYSSPVDSEQGNTVASEYDGYICVNYSVPAENQPVAEPVPVIDLTQYQYVKPYKYVLRP